MALIMSAACQRQLSLDKLVIIAVNTETAEGKSVLQVRGHHIEDGQLAWRRDLLLSATPGGLRGVQQAAPNCIVHMGRVLVLGNNGAIALVDANGMCERMWRYRRINPNLSACQSSYCATARHDCQ